MILDYLVSITLLACECNGRAKELVKGLVKGSSIYSEINRGWFSTTRG